MLCDSAGSGEYWAQISVLILSCTWQGWDSNDSGYHRVTHGSFCTETSFYTEDIYIYLYIFTYIYIHPHTQTHSRIHTHARITHTHKVFDRLSVFYKNSWQPGSKAKKRPGCCRQCPLQMVSQADTCVYLTEPVPAWDRNSRGRRRRSRTPSAALGV